MIARTIYSHTATVCVHPFNRLAFSVRKFARARTFRRRRVVIGRSLIQPRRLWTLWREMKLSRRISASDRKAKQRSPRRGEGTAAFNVLSVHIRTNILALLFMVVPRTKDTHTPRVCLPRAGDELARTASSPKLKLNALTWNSMPALRTILWVFSF